MSTTSSPHPKLASAIRTFATRRVPSAAMIGVSTDVAPRPGNLALARVDAVGQHTRVQRADARRKHLVPGDELIVAYAQRYAPQQMEALVPTDLEPCHLIAAGGVAGKVISTHGRVVRRPTEITPLGLVAGADGRPLQLEDFRLPPEPEAEREPAGRGPVTIAFLGAAMDSGKTTAAAYLARGLTRCGLRVGYAKVTGTGSGNDLWLVGDAGADPVVDFTDAGFASTYGVPVPALEEAMRVLLAHLAGAGVDVRIVELADGPVQPETGELLASTTFRDLTDGVVFAAPDALGAAAGVELLRRHGATLLAVSGSLTASPLHVREALKVTSLPVLGRNDLSDPETARKLVLGARADSGS